MNLQEATIKALQGRLDESEDKWEPVYSTNGKVSYRKQLRRFKDKDNNVFTLYLLPNNHSELTIQKDGENGAQIITGSKEKIVNEIRKYWKGEGTFTDI